MYKILHIMALCDMSPDFDFGGNSRDENITTHCITTY